MNCDIDSQYLLEKLLELLSIHSPTGYTDPIVRNVCATLDELEISYELTRRGAIRATIPGTSSSPDRAVVAHVDTVGALVRELKANGRLAVVPVGTWSSRLAEGARVSIFTDDGVFRGQVLPLKASGHTYHEALDTQPVSWDNLEIRVDERVYSQEDLIHKCGFNVGDFVGFDATPETFANGYINARHLDDKAGVAAVLAAAKYLVNRKEKLPVDMHLLFTISEEVGSGASAILHGDVAEMITVDNGTAAPGQASSEFGVTIAIADSGGPFDYHLTHHLIHLCQANEIPYARDIFRYYHCDSASALDAGNDIRTALLTFGVDGSHGYERTNLHSLVSVAQLLVAYATQRPLYAAQVRTLNSIETFPKTRKTDVDGARLTDLETIEQVPPEPTGRIDDPVPGSAARSRRKSKS